MRHSWGYVCAPMCKKVFKIGRPWLEPYIPLPPSPLACPLGNTRAEVRVDCLPFFQRGGRMGSTCNRVIVCDLSVGSGI